MEDREKLCGGLFQMDPKAKREFSKGREIAPWAEGRCPQNLSRGRTGAEEEEGTAPWSPWLL